jgi:hypothetical protein
LCLFYFILLIEIVVCSSELDGSVFYLRNVVTTLNECDFINCSSKSRGGVVRVVDSGSFISSNCVYINNSAGVFGGVYFSDGTTLSLCLFEDSTFTNCSSDADGSLMWMHPPSNGTVINCSCVACVSVNGNGLFKKLNFIVFFCVV